MFCPKCGAAMEEGVKVCQNCGLDTTTVEQISNQETDSDDTISTTEVSQVAVLKPKISIVGFVYFGLAAVVLIMFFIAAGNISSGGNEIMQIQSVGGKTLEEAYYYELGTIYAGYAMLCRALGISFASVLVWLGISNK